MKKHLLFAFTNPIEGKEAEYNHWYDTVAMPTYKSLPGLIPLGRFDLVDIKPMFDFDAGSQYKYASLYYFEADDAEAFMETLKAALATRTRYHFTDTIDQTKFFEPIFVARGDINFAPINRYEAEKTQALA